MVRLRLRLGKFGQTAAGGKRLCLRGACSGGGFAFRQDARQALQKAFHGIGQRFALAKVQHDVIGVLGKIQHLHNQVFVRRFQAALFDQPFGKVGILLVAGFAQCRLLFGLQFFQFGFGCCRFLFGFFARSIGGGEFVYGCHFFGFLCRSG